MNRIKAGILGCTGAVGQKLISLLGEHPLFEISALAASESSAGKIYGKHVNWKEPGDIPKKAENSVIQRCDEQLDAKVLFSGLDSSVAGEIEKFYAGKGYAVISNSKNHRMDDDVPLIIPEINATHTALIENQKKRFSGGGFIVTNPNCSTVVLSVALYPVYKNFGLERVIVTTMQAISGAGYPGVPSMDILGNIIPHIKDEEEKIETEPQKIFGELKNGRIEFADFKISAMCNRVPVRDGHTMTISFDTKKKAQREDIIKALKSYDNLNLPSSPEYVLKYYDNQYRPQPLLDSDRGNGMTVTAGNLRRCSVLDWKLTASGHNTIRGAAGAAILNAEYLIKMKLIK